MSNDVESNSTAKAKPRAGRLRRWLGRIAIVLAVLVGVFVSFRLIYPAWTNARVSADAPRIAFSLDNTLLGRIGITDATYQRVISAAGGRLVVLRPDAAGKPVRLEAVKVLLEEKQIDGVLLTGGGDVDPALYDGDPNATMLVHRLRDDFEIALIHAAREKGLPILGICRGCQILNVALGGTVLNLRREQDIKSSHLTLSGHAIELAVDSCLAKTLGVTHLSHVVSLHGQVVGEPGDAVRIVATGPGGVAEAIETDSAGHRGWIVGLQWHPELTNDKAVQHRIFEALVDRARQVSKLR
jgi:putative glutamine amidotransferase